MFDQLMQSFTQSPQGQRAFAQLQGQGYTPQQASGMLSAALPAAARAMQGSLGSMLGGGAAGMLGGGAAGMLGSVGQMFGGGAPAAAPAAPGMVPAGLGMMPGATPGGAPPAPAGGGNPLSGLMAMIPGMGGSSAAPAHGAPAAGQDPSVLSQLASVGQSGYAVNFLSAAVSGMVRGQGMKNSAIDGLQGVVGGHVAEVIAGQFGLPRRVAGVAGAVITPLMVDFLWEKFQGGGLQSMIPGFGGGASQGDPSQQLGAGPQAQGASPGFGTGMFQGPAAAPGFGAGLFGGSTGGYTPPRFSGWGRTGG